ncbi:MAG: MFS transporter [Bacilli bacterium]
MENRALVEREFDAGEIHRLGAAGFGRNIGFGANKVFTGAMLAVLQVQPQIIGIILGLEGLFGLLFLPVTGWLSDRTRRPGWRRKAYLWVAFPGSALTWMAFYYAGSASAAIWILVAFYFFQQLSVSPYLAWMPDLVSESKRGMASGYLNLWWEIGNLVSFLVIPMMWEYLGHSFAFGFASFLILAGGLITVLTVREPTVDELESDWREAHATHAVGSDAVAAAETGVKTAESGRGAGASAAAAIGGGGVAASWALLLRGDLAKFYIVQALSWVAFEAIASFFTLFIVHGVGGTVFDSAIGMSIFTITGVVTALWFGRLYTRISPRDSMAVMLGLFAVVSLAAVPTKSLIILYVLLAIAGVLWGGIQIISYALAADLLERQMAGGPMGAQEMHGRLYAIFGIAQAVGLLVAAPLAGFFIQASGGHYGSMFWASFLAGAIAMAVSFMIKQTPPAAFGSGAASASR